MNPGANLAGELVGMLVPGMGVVKAGKAAVTALGAAGRATLPRVAGVLGAGAAAEGAVVAAGHAPEGEKGKAAAVGAAVSAPFGVAAPFVGRATRPFRSNQTQAGVEGRNILQQTGQKVEDLFKQVRERMRHEALGGVATMADVDKSIGGRLPGIVKLAPQLRNAGGPFGALRTRILPKQAEIARKAIWAPFNGVNTRDKAIIGFIKSNPEARRAATMVLKGNIENVNKISVPQLQDIRRVMLKSATRAEKSGIRTEADAIFQSRLHLTNQMERIVPGYKVANGKWSEVLTMQKDAKRLIEAVDNALPAFSPEIPNRADGLMSTVRETLSNSSDRRSAIAEIVGEALMTEGEAGITRIEKLIRQGWFSRLLRGTAVEAVSGSALGVPGLLSGGQLGT